MKKDTSPTTTKQMIKIYLPKLEDFLLNLQTNNYSRKTIYSYENDLQTFEDFLKESGVPFSKISKQTINYYKAYLNSIDRLTAKNKKTEKTLTSLSINRLLSSLRSYLKYLIEMDCDIPIAPEAVKLVKTERKHPRVAELNDLIAIIESPSHLENNKLTATRNRAMLEILFSTGMRISEMISLDKSQIDNSGRVFIRGKGKKERFAYLTPRAYKYINDYLKMRDDDAPALFIPYRGANSKKTSGTKRRISPNYLQAKIKQYREKLKIIVPISAHSLRHGFATYLVEDGANPAAIQILLGHESLDTTTRYVHPSDRYAEKIHNDFHPLKDID